LGAGVAGEGEVAGGELVVVEPAAAACVGGVVTSSVVDALAPACTSSPAYVAVIVRVPADPGVYLTEQPDTAVDVSETKGQVRSEPKPASPASDVKLTFPVGRDAVPGEMSLSVAVHVAGCAATTAEPQLTETVVARAPTGSVPCPLEALCVGSPA
jgi:hypothetical protein